MFKKGNNIFSLLIIVLSIFMTSSVNIVNADTASNNEPSSGQSANETNGSTGTILSDGTEPSDTTKQPATKSTETLDDAQETTTKDWKDSLITLAQLQDQNRKPQKEFDENQSMYAYWEFATGNNVLHDGDTMEVSVPKDIALSNSDDSPVVDKLTGEEIGTAHLDSSTRSVKIVFNATAAQKSAEGNLQGSFWVNVRWDVNTVNVDTIIPIDWNLTGTATNPNTTTSVTVHPSAPDGNEVLYKWGGFIKHSESDANPYAIEWTVRVNYADTNIENAVYKDVIDSNQELLHDDQHPITVQPVTFNHTNGNPTNQGNPLPDSSISTNSNDFSVNLGNLGPNYTNQGIIITYYTKITSSTILPVYNNTGELLGNNKEIQSVSINQATNKVGSDADTNAANYLTSIVGNKIWAVSDKSEIPNTSLTIDLLSDGNVTDHRTISAKDNWIYEFYNLPIYKVTQDTNGKNQLTPIHYSVNEEDVPEGFTAFQDSTNYNITNAPNSEFTVTKVWHDGKDQDDHDPITVTINHGTGTSDGSAILSKDNDWTYTFKNLPSLGTGERYYVDESNIPSGYISNDSYKDGNQYYKVVTNTLATSLKVTKAWDDNDNANNTRPDSIQVQLYANDNNTGDKKLGDPITLDNDNSWTHTFGANVKDPSDADKSTNQLPKYDSNNKEITYSAKEVTKLDDYTTTYSQPDATSETITNTSTSTTPPTDDKTTLNVIKKWNDNDNQDKNRPSSIKVQLYSGSEKVGTEVTLDETNSWKYQFTGLDKDKTYTVEETGLDTTKYTSSQKTSGNTVTITNTPKSTSTTPSNKTHNLTVQKIWRDNDNQDKTRPNKISVQLYADGKASGYPVDLMATNNWTHQFTELDNNVTYTIQEQKVAGYDTNITQPTAADPTVATIYNTKTSTPTNDNKKTLTVTKHWNDNNNQDQLRPDQVTVHLLKDGKIIGNPITLNKLNGWSYTWTDLDKASQYTVQEDTVPSYTTSQTTSNNVVTITNSHTPTDTTKTPGNPETPDNPKTPVIPTNPSTPDTTTTTPNGDNNQTSFTPSNPLVPNVPYDKTSNNPNSLLPQTGSKAISIIYTIIGIILLSFIITVVVRKRLV